MYLASGTYLLFMKHAGLTILMFAIILFYFLCKGYLKIRRTAGLFYLLFFIFWEMLNYFLINSNHLSNGDESMIVTHCVYAICSYIIISNLNIYEYKKIFLNISYYFALIGLLAYTLVILGMRNYTISGNVKLCLLQNLSWTVEEPRLAGMFWEPGAYQITLLICFILYWDDIRMNMCGKAEKYKLLVLAIAMFASQSSWGYVCFAYYLFSVSIGRKITRKTLISFVGTLMILLCGSYYMLTSSVVSNKLRQAENTNAVTSYSVRMNDNMALIQMLREKPFFGYGIATLDFKKRSDELNNATSSNGLLQMGATLGVFMLIIFIIYTYKAAKSMFLNRIWLIFPLFIFLHLAEVFYYFPLSYVLLFQFKTYKHLTS